MLLDDRFAPFIAQRPLCVMARALLQRLLAPEALDKLFARTAQTQYTRELLFSSLVHLMCDVVFDIQPAVHAAFHARRQQLPVSLTSLYKKLTRLETAVSEELLKDSAQQAWPLIQQLDATQPAWLPGYRCLILDGNHLPASQRRLPELQQSWASALPGQALVVYDPQARLVVDVFLHQDGHASERSLLGRVLQSVQPGQLWLADRMFCTSDFLHQLHQKNACFILRQHGTLLGQEPGPSQYVGRSKTGEVCEHSLLVEHPQTGDLLKLRRISVTLDKPTRSGAKVLHLLSNVPSACADAVSISELYQKRWTIENAFAEIAQTLSCEIKTLAYPQAALFALSLGLVAYNVVSVLKAALRSVHGESQVQEKLSVYFMTLEIKQSYDGMMIAIAEEHWQVFGAWQVEQLVLWLRQVAGGLSWQRYPKQSRKRKKKKAGPKKPYRNGEHLSTAKILEQRKKRQP